MNIIKKNPVRNGHARSLPEKSESWRMFNEISPHYDLLNRLLSFGIDGHWRRTLSKYLSMEAKRNILDLATGTGDVLITLMKKHPQASGGLGLDLADKMLEIGRRKIEKAGLSEEVTLKNGDAAHLPVENASFENVTIAFGIRNMPEPKQVLREMHRALIPGGRALILEFSLPENKLLRALHLFYLRRVVPALGGLISGNKEAYRYLNSTIEEFPYGTDFTRLMEETGFIKHEAMPLMGGIATIYVGEK